MDRRSVFRLAALLASGSVLAGCIEAPRNDGRMFQRWAEAVAEIPTTDEEAAARDAERARATLARAGRPVPDNLTAQVVAVAAEQAGLRPAMSVDVVDPLELPNARDLGLRGMMTVADAVVAERPAQLVRTGASVPVQQRLGHPAPPGGYAARLAAFRTRQEAEAAWNRLKSANAGLLAGVAPRFETVDLGARGKWVRLMTSALPTQAAAARVCRAAGVADPWCANGRPA